MRIDAIAQMNVGEENLQHLSYTSDAGSIKDWALLRLPEKGNDWVVCIHGHGSSGNQLYTREDIRRIWLPEFARHGLGILTPNLRGNGWMGPAAETDMSELLDFLRSEYGAQRFIFASGSMGGTSNLIYASLNPENVSAAIALGAASDLAVYDKWCRERNQGVISEIADAIEQAYGKNPETYKKHSVIENAKSLTMPVFISHGSRDELIPVSQMRTLCGCMVDAGDFVYSEIPDGNHDSPLVMMPMALDWAVSKIRPEL